jgi:hypothetical protein
MSGRRGAMCRASPSLLSVSTKPPSRVRLISGVGLTARRPRATMRSTIVKTAAVDEVVKKAGIATSFVKSGDDNVRVATSVKLSRRGWS